MFLRIELKKKSSTFKDHLLSIIPFSLMQYFYIYILSTRPFLQSKYQQNYQNIIQTLSITINKVDIFFKQDKVEMTFCNNKNVGIIVLSEQNIVMCIRSSILEDIPPQILFKTIVVFSSQDWVEVMPLFDHVSIIIQKMKQKMACWWLIMTLWLVNAQDTAPISAGTTFDTSIPSTISVLQEPASPYNPDFYMKFVISTQNIYLLGSNNIVDIYSKAYPNTLVQRFMDYNYSIPHVIRFVDLSVNNEENLIVLTSYNSGQLVHMLFSLDHTGILSWLNNTTPATINAPQTTFLKGNFIYSYIKGAGPDQVRSVNITDHSVINQVLSFQNYTVEISPYANKALTWSKWSQVHVYNITNGNFVLDQTFTGNLIPQTDRLSGIDFSSDGQLAIIEVDDKGDVKIFNMTDNSTLHSFSGGSGRIDAAIFLDPGNRFIYLQKESAPNHVYDTLTDTRADYTGSLGLDIRSDLFSSQIYSLDGSNFHIYNFNLTVNNSLSMSYLFPTIPPPSTPSPTPTPSSQDKHQFYEDLQLTQPQNKTVQYLNQGLSKVSVVVQNSFSFIFSTPLAAFFLSLLNYFTLSSLYVLLDIRIPKIVFKYLQQIFQSCQSDLPSQLGFTWKMDKWSEERVDEKRPLYFGVTSDFVSQSLNEACIVFANFILFELFILFTHLFKRLSKTRKTLVKYRGQIYIGLVISNSIELLIAWKYSFFGGFRTFPSKVTIGAQYILLYLIPFLGIASLLCQLDDNQKSYKRYVRVSLLNWWPIYETLIFSIMILVSNPLYFMIVIGISNLFAFYNSFYAPKWKVSCIFKAIYPVILHSCFFVFMFVKDNKILANVSIAFLSIILLGAVHHFAESLVVLAIFFYKGLKKLFKSNSIQPKKQKGLKKTRKKNKKKEKKKKIKEQQGSKEKSTVITGTFTKNVNFQLHKDPNDWRIKLQIKDPTTPLKNDQRDKKSNKKSKIKTQKQNSHLKVNKSSKNVPSKQKVEKKSIMKKKK